MAKWWRKGNFGRKIVPVIAAGLVIAFAVAAQGLGVSGGGVWSDPRNGLAIGGYDPVAYFVAREPRIGRRAHELKRDGAAWQFESAANRAVFERDPEVYAPRFGGYDPMRLAEDFVAMGNPLLWMVIDDRLFLFVSKETRQRWLFAEQSLRARADENWPALVAKSQ